MKKESLASKIFVVWIVGLGWALIAQIVPTFLGILGVSTDTLLGDPRYQLLFLYTESIGIFCMYIKYHADATLLPFHGTRNVRNYLIGWFSGTILFSVVWGVITFLGGYHIRFIFSISSSTSILLFLIGFGIQAMFEELLTRGYVMGIFLKENRPLLSIIVNSAFFSFLHIGNPHFDWNAAIGLFLFGILMSELRMITHSIWFCSAVHAAWNFSEGIIFGTTVSGLPNMGLVIRSFSTTSTQLLTGGSFGIERSGVSIIIHIILITFLAFFISKSTYKNLL